MATQEKQRGLSLEELQALSQTSPSGLAWVANLRSPSTGSPSSWIHARHVDHVDNLIVELVAGELRKAGYIGLIVEEPPRHGKSELCSHYTPVWYLGARPDNRVIMVSYEATFAASWGRKARNTMGEVGQTLYGLEVDPRSSAADRWDIKGKKGGMYTAGALSGITGRGANLLIFDDLIKNQQDAQSEVLRDKTWEEWKNTFRTRLEPDGVILGIGTRWHEDDVIGRLIRAQGDGPHGKNDPLYDPRADRFLVVRLPAVAEEPDEEYPDADPLGRAPGEVLFPERWPLELLSPHMANELTWAALFQQRPTPKEGALFQEGWLEVVSHPGGRWRKKVRFWDTASTDPKEGEDPDWTVGLIMGLNENGLYYVLDVVRFRLSPGKFEAKMKEVTKLDRKNKGIRYRVAQEPGSQGKLYIRVLAGSIFLGLNMRGFRETGSKYQRADLVAGAAERGEIKLVRGAWNREFLREVKRFPFATHDDQVDALSGAYAVLTGRGARGMVTW